MDTRRFARRAALRGGLAAGLAAAVTAPWRRSAVTTAAAAGLAAGAALELPGAGAVGALVLATAVARGGRAGRSGRGGRAGRGGRLRRADVAAAMATGVLAAAGSTRVWPVAPRTPAEIRPALTPIGAEPTDSGDGLVIVVNAAAGSALRANPAEALRELLPGATVVEADADGFEAALGEAANACRALGVAGGDGSIGTAAAVAHEAGLPLFIAPAGTLNHLARDLGLVSPEDSVEALRQGSTVAVDVATIDGRTFLNTASFGAYGDLVDARELLEDRIGKWPALCVALVRVLRRARPVEVELNGERRRLWMIFIGNCRYHPAGFAPTWRERMDDGRLDVRLVDAVAPWARTRLLLAVLTGRLGRSRVYEAFTAKELRVRSLGEEPLRLARDGETFDGSAEFVVRKEETPLAVYVPSASSRRSQRPNSTSTETSTTTPAPVSHGPAAL